MTAVRGDLIAQVTGPAFVDPEILTADEWYEIIVRASSWLTIRSLRRMSTLRQIVISCDVPSGIPSQVDTNVLSRGMLTMSTSNPNTAFLKCVSIALRPEKLPGEAKHILMSRDLEFYELKISWEMGYNAPVAPRYYNATRVEIYHRDLRSLLNDYGKLRIGSRNRMLFGRWILWSFLSAQRETSADLDAELIRAQETTLRLGHAYNSLVKPAVAV